MPEKWLQPDDFLNSMGGPVRGLPKKKVHVDTDRQPTKSQQTGGMLYAAEEHADAVNASPPLNCPCCGQRAVDLAGATQIYRLDVQEAGGKSHKADVPPCPLSSLVHPPMFYAVEPCGCRVSQEWAGAFSAELQDRMAGLPPKAVADITPKQRDAKLAVLEGQLAKLYSLQSASTGQAKRDVDYWIVIVADQIQRLCPGPHNMLPAKPLTPEVSTWAAGNGLTVPPNADVAMTAHAAGMISTDSLMNIFGLGKPKAIETGTPVYRMADGTVSPHPSFPGQESCGVAAAAATAYEPEVGRTKTKQWYVRFKDIYKVFVGKVAAEDYAHALAVQNQSPAPKSPATTLEKPPPAVNVVGGTPEEKAAYEQALYATLLSGPADLASSFTRDVAKQVLKYVAENEFLAISLYQQADANAWRPLDLMQGLQRVRAELVKYVAGTGTPGPQTVKYVKLFVDYVEMPLPGKAAPAEPEAVPAPAPAPPPAPPRNLTARKKRTIRYVDD